MMSPIQLIDLTRLGVFVTIGPKTTSSKLSNPAVPRISTRIDEIISDKIKEADLVSDHLRAVGFPWPVATTLMSGWRGKLTTMMVGSEV